MCFRPQVYWSEKVRSFLWPPPRLEKEREEIKREGAIEPLQTSNHSKHGSTAHCVYHTLNKYKDGRCSTEKIKTRVSDNRSIITTNNERADWFLFGDTFIMDCKVLISVKGIDRFFFLI